MSNQLSVFQFQSSYEVRIQLINNEPFFCLKDVCSVLDIKNHKDLLAKQIDNKGVEKIYLPTNGGNQYVVFINEPNLYRVIFRSNKPEAKQFQDWVFNDVLPTIRKTGAYSVVDKSNYITSQQLQDLKHIINNISNAFFYTEAFTQGVWKMIRDATDADSIQHIRKDRLYLISAEIEKMLKVTQMYLTLRRDTESEIIKKIFRNHNDQYIILFNVKHEHAYFLSNLDKMHEIHLNDFNKKLIADIK
ncbi:BRO-N domain-containing protein [Gilliamella sp. Pas-s25]|uniref:BRO-N domain-containing protein n=1 Tax=Gilliamella sp. Pas-s25 TaxID=2687310 RepID=UPI00135E1498|nr:BRO family protein [Gilliamella sp. Pas-s25]MWP62040.1 phage antirepressor protein [Gilliamella sp. Pas-s25]